jgi:hypothetical protein
MPFQKGHKKIKNAYSFPKGHKVYAGFKKGHKVIGGYKNNEENINWKGNEVSYSGLHKWIQRKLGKPSFCESCRNGKLKNRQYHWANVSGKYLRELADWVRLCVRCHKKYDLLKQK